MADHATTQHDSAHEGHESHEGHHHGRYHPHVVPLWLLTAVFVALLVLTYITVSVTYFDLGALNLPIALLIAATKASLVGLYFMHLRWDSPFNSVALVAAFLFLSLFLWFTILDSGEYQPQMERTIDREGLQLGEGGAAAEEAAGDEAAAEE